jgi:S1-C subfamily serine protease
VRTAELPQERAAPEGPVSGSKLGLQLQTLTPELAERLGLERGSKGAVITSVAPGSVAAEGTLFVALPNPG